MPAGASSASPAKPAEVTPSQPNPEAANPREAKPPEETFVGPKQQNEDTTGKVLLVDSLGQVKAVPPEEIARGLTPPAEVLKNQVPEPSKGAKASPVVQKRIAENSPNRLTFFPSSQPQLMSYLASQDVLGNTAARPGALIRFFPAEPAVQGAKSRLSEFGLRYNFNQDLTYADLSDPMTGANHLLYYNANIFSKWAVFAYPSAGAAGWFSAQVKFKAGIGGGGQDETAQTNLGTLTNPTGLTSLRNGFRVPELAWQQSLHKGTFVFLAGVINQSNYIDSNLYANTARGQFLNTALSNSMVIPLPSFNFGINLQWQPTDSWYALLAATAGNALAGQVPWENFSWDHWSTTAEFGVTPDDVLGLGPGVYRIQPFLARAGGKAQGGVGINLQQALGQNSPFAWFGRFGAGASAITAGASAQVGTGFVMRAPLAALGIAPTLTNDLAGVAFVWSQPSATTRTIYHEDEYIFETFYTLQFSSTSRLQPDLQVVWNPVFNPDPGPSLVFQIQYLLAW